MKHRPNAPRNPGSPYRPRRTRRDVERDLQRARTDAQAHKSSADRLIASLLWEVEALRNHRVLLEGTFEVRKLRMAQAVSHAAMRYAEGDGGAFMLNLKRRALAELAQGLVPFVREEVVRDDHGADTVYLDLLLLAPAAGRTWADVSRSAPGAVHLTSLEARLR